MVPKVRELCKCLLSLLLWKKGGNFDWVQGVDQHVHMVYGLFLHFSGCSINILLIFQRGKKKKSEVRLK